MHTLFKLWEKYFPILSAEQSLQVGVQIGDEVEEFSDQQVYHSDPPIVCISVFVEVIIEVDLQKILLYERDHECFFDQNHVNLLHAFEAVVAFVLGRSIENYLFPYWIWKTSCSCGIWVRLRMSHTFLLNLRLLNCPLIKISSNHKAIYLSSSIIVEFAFPCNVNRISYDWIILQKSLVLN